MRNHQDPFARKNRPGYKPLFTSRTLTSVLALGTALAAPVTNAISGNYTTGNVVGTYTGTIPSGTKPTVDGSYAGQAFLGTMTNGQFGTSASGYAGVDANTDRIYIGSTTAVLNWAPNDTTAGGGAAINMLASGKTLEFVNDTGSSDFTVVNRILPTGAAVGRQIGIYGNIRSYQFDNTTIAGNVWLYSPGGLLIGNTANINVGGLILSSLDPTNFNSNGANFTNTSSLTRGGPVQIVTGAQIMANNYIGVIAPSIVQQGNVTVGTAGGTTNAGAAYVAVEEATININQGLFDIQVTQGTDGGTTLQDGSHLVLLHEGSTTGPAADTAATNVQQRVALVAVPKNTAITMLVQGTGKLGFDVATGAQQDRAAIILSGGHNVSLGNYSPSNPGSVFGAPSNGPSQTTINVNGSSLSTLNDPKFKNDVVGMSNGNASLLAVNGTRLDFARGLNFNTTHRSFADGGNATGGTLSLTANTGGAVTVGGLTVLQSDGYGGSALYVSKGGSGRGGLVSLNANGGTMSLGEVVILSNGFGGEGYDVAAGGDGYGGGDPNNPPTGGTGGYIGTNNGGSLTINGPVRIEASGVGGIGYGQSLSSGPGTDGGTGYGGRAVIFANSNQTLTIQGTTLIYAEGLGGNGGNAGAAKGGYAQIGALNASPTITGNVLLSANATSGVVNTPGGSTLNTLAGGFAAVGGSAVLTRDGTGSTQINGAVNANANAYVDNPNPFRAVAGGGNAQGGNADIYTSGGTINVAGAFFGNANAYGGSAFNGALTGSGTGGRASINGTAGTTVSITGYTELSADGVGGSTSDGEVGGAGFGGSGTTGGVYVGGAGGNIQLAQLVGHANGTGGDAITIGGNGTGGTAQVSTFTNGGAITISQGLRLRADGTGGTANGQSMQVFAPQTPTGGDGFGGLAFLGAGSGSITVGPFVELIANGAGGTGVQGGIGLGGGAQNSDTIFRGAVLQARLGGQVTVNDNTQANQYGVFLTARGDGGFSSSEYGEVGNGGIGVGGLVQLQAQASTGPISQVSVGRVIGDATGQGGTGGSPSSDPVDGGTGGDGFGGIVSIYGTAGGGRLIVASSATMSARGIGGFGGDGGTDGEGAGVGGTGGAGYGGSVQGGVISGSSSTVTNGSASFGSYIVDVTGQGGEGGYGAFDGESYVSTGGTGGKGVGGGANILSRGAPVTSGLTSITAVGSGGNGGLGDVQGNGGDGYGGSASAIASSRFQTTTVSTMSLGSTLTLLSNGAAGGGTVGGVSYRGGFQLQALDGATLNAGTVTINNTGAVGNRPFFNPFTNASGSEAVDPSNISALFGGQLNITGTGGLTVSASQANVGLNVDGGSTLSVTNTATFQVANVVQFYRPNGTDANNQPFAPITSFATSGIFNANAFVFVLPTTQSINTSAILNKTSGSLTLGVPGAIKVGGLRALGGNVTVTSQGGAALDLGTIIAGGSVLLNVSPSAPTTPLTGSTITTADITAGASVIAAGPSVTTGNVVAGDTIGLTSTVGGVTYGTLSAGLVNPVQQSQQGYAVGIRSAGAILGGAINARGNVGAVSQTSTVTTGDIGSQQSIVLLSSRAVTTGNLNAASTTGGVYIANSSMFATNNGSLDPAVYFQQTPVPVSGVQGTPGTITVGNVSAARFRAASAGVFRAGNIAASTLLNLSSNSNFILGDITAPTITLAAPAIQTGALSATGAISLNAPIAIVAGNVNAASLIAQSGGVARFGDITTSGVIFVGSFAPPQQLVGAQTPGTVLVGNVTSSGGGVNLFSQRGTVTAGNINVAGFAQLSAQVGSITTGNIQASEVGLFALGAITTGSVTATNGEIDIEAGPDDENDDFIATPGADVTTGALVATDEISVTGGGNVRIASATVNAPRTRNPEEFYEVKIGAGGNITVGDISAPGTIALGSLTGAIAAGNITTQDAVAVLAGGNASFGSVTTAGTGYVYVGNASQIGLVDTDDGIDTSLLLATAPVRAGGAVSFAGPVTTGRFDVASTTGFSSTAVTASSVRVNTGGAASFGGAVTTPGAFTVSSGAFTAAGINAASVQVAASGAASFNGAVVAPTINVASNDIAIGANGSLGGASTTALTLTNSGTGPSTLGGTAQATGYTLDASEIGRLRATQIAFNSTGNVTFNAASINASTALNGATGGFRVTTPASIRIAGNVDFTNMAATNTATFVAGQRFEVVTPTGQLRLLGANNAVNGVANITAANVAIGSATLLDQLAANPRFTGRDTALALGNSGTAVNSSGYIQAGTLAFTVGNTLLIANSGTATAPAGFTAGTGGVTVAAQGQGTTPIDVVIYGRSLDAAGTPSTSSGTVSTVVIAPGSTARISTTSTVNGCGFGGATCTAGAVVTNTVQNQLTQIAATLQSAVTGIGGGATNGPAGGAADNGGTSNNNAASDQGSDGEDDGGDDGTSAATSSAVRVNVLIDTSSIGGGGPSFDTPVTSSGNASLWGGDAGGDVGSTGAGGLGDTSGPLGDLGGGGALGGGSFGGAAGGAVNAGGGAGASFGAGATGGTGGTGASLTGGASGGTTGGTAGGSASTGGTASTGGSASTGGTASTGGAAGSTTSASGGTEGGASTQGGGSTGGANADGGATGQSGGTAATPSGEAGAGGTAATAATEGTSNSGGGGGEAGASGSDAGTTPGGAAGGAAGGASGGANGGNNKDEKTDKPQGGTTGGIN